MGLFGVSPLLAAYGRSYTSIEAMQVDFDADKDFLTPSGSYTNRADLLNHCGMKPGEKIQAHFGGDGRNTETDMLTVKSNEEIVVTKKPQAMKYPKWMKEVGASIEKKFRADLMSLGTDWPSRDAFDDGLTPEEAVEVWEEYQDISEAKH